ncbi:lipase 3-like [Polyergus mexicanus]|uniref:lipase 3-like n=1 Tax=Polyergus mexicanus TaxID=615972 RepID=UPI0038B49095
MRLIAVTCLLSLCSSLGAESAVTLEPSAFAKNISWFSLNPDVVLNTPEIIKRAGYPAEAYVVTTEDGYLLTLHRIPGGKGSLPVLLQHAFLCTSADWVILGKGKALAYLLADQGYDVWLGNFRGNTYSRAHISLSPFESKFWDFSFNEIGIYDLPAMITFITNMTLQPLHTYIGHSMGTTSFYVMASKRPEIAQMVKMMISLAPAAFVKSNIKSPITYISLFWREIKLVTQLFSYDKLLSQSNLLRFLSKYDCNQNLVQQKFCARFIFLICGDDPEQFDYALLPVILSHDPAGSSTKTFLHYLQAFQTNKFRQYDYGRKRNLLMYNSTEPPDYDLTNITVPIALFYGANDWLVNISEVQKLSRLLPNVMDMYEVPWPKFNHVDFVWAKDAPKLVYKRILKLIKGKDPNNIIEDNTTDKYIY